ncbi:WD40-repeat-containing domain protein [Suillus subaureus]|uniref:WD40-repeat-containing domain protein n=1 Tax=Suillus subaureus TaxID=48587 RepID=A0A9P7ELQ7_9AGAM|nr:WD40-repeat-containing domain protein [Suillus subaureus]KAG1825644.1 WD40-repeat-containing domain protein [Suillus subaureus]
MASTGGKSRLKTVYKNKRSIGPLHTCGSVAVSGDGSKLVTCVAEEAVLTNILTGEEICRFAGDTQSITSLCLTPSASQLIVFTSAPSLQIKFIPCGWIARAHDAPVHVCTIDPSSTYLASGSADGVVKVWDIKRGYVTHIFKGHGGIVSALKFNFPRDPSVVVPQNILQLITASVDTRIRIFDLTAAANKGDQGALRPIAVLEGHVSVPRGLDVTPDGKWLISGGRDSVVLVWNLHAKSTGAKSAEATKGKGKSNSPVLAQTIPVMERVEAVGLLQAGDLVPSGSASQLRFYTAGEKGIIRIWDVKNSSVLYSLSQVADLQTGDQEEQRQIVEAVYLPLISTLVSVHADQNILFYDLNTRNLHRQLIGFNDEIVDAVFLSPNAPKSVDSHIAFATNSSLIRIYSTAGLDARLLTGHTEIVLSLDHGAGGKLFASGSKDRSVRLWAPASPNDDLPMEWGCVAICEGHAESVGTIAMSRTSGESGTAGVQFMFSGSQDRTIKMWYIGDVPLVFDASQHDQSLMKCKSLTTHKAHEKDINSLDVAPNDRLLASGSQDRTAKIYGIDFSRATGDRSAHGEIKLLGTCKGHKRGIWTVKFGRSERVLATGSGDKTVKLWNLEDFTCVKTFEGHTNSVLRVDFVDHGMQLVTSASDGLVKLWNVREEECTATMDNHEDKVWALAISTDERTIVSAAADSVVTFWQDCTEEQERENEAKRSELVLREQDFMNYLSLHDYRKAIQLALAMQQPGRLLSLFKGIRATPSESAADASSVTGNSSVDEVLRTLGGSDLARLLRYVRDWNPNAKTSGVAQGVLYAVMKLRSVDDVIAAFTDEAQEGILQSSGQESVKSTASGNTALKELVDSMIPYTERHLSRMDRLVQDSFVVDYILSEMDDGMFDGQDVGTTDIDIEIAFPVNHQK